MSQDYMKALLEERNKANKAARDIVDAALAEKRNLTAEDNEAIARADADFEAKNAMMSELRKIEEREDAIRSAVASAPESRPSEAMGAKSDEDLLRSIALGETRGHEFRSEQRDVFKSATGAPVPTGFWPEIQTLLRDYSGPLSLGQVINTTSGENISVPRTNAYSTGTVNTEGNTLGESDPTFQSFLTLGAWKFGTLFQFSRELIDDAGVNLQSYFAYNLGQALGYAINSALTVGTGCNTATGVVPSAGSGVTGTVSGTFDYNTVVDLYYSLDPAVRASNKFAFMASTGGIKRLRKLVDTTGQPLWQPAVIAGEPDRLLGKPISENVAMADIGAGNSPVIAGDWNSFLIRIAGGMRIEQSSDFAFSADLITIKAVMRLDSGLPQSSHIKYLRCLP